MGLLRMAAPDRLKAIQMLLKTGKIATNPYIWTCDEDMQATQFWSSALKESCKNANGHRAAENEKQPQIHTSGPTLKTCKPGYLDLVPNFVSAKVPQWTHEHVLMTILLYTGHCTTANDLYKMITKGHAIITNDL